jgi:hypothetical protein
MPDTDKNVVIARVIDTNVRSPRTIGVVGVTVSR